MVTGSLSQVPAYSSVRVSPVRVGCPGLGRDSTQSSYLSLIPAGMGPKHSYATPPRNTGEAGQSNDPPEEGQQALRVSLCG